MAVGAAFWWLLPRRLVGAGLCGAVLIACLLLAGAPPSGPSFAELAPVKGAESWAALPAATRLSVSRALGDAQAEAGHGLSTGAGLALRTRFTASGVAVSIASTRLLRLGLSAIGRGRSLRPVSLAAPVAHANAVSYRHPGALERYRNTSAGLEQSFILARRPAGSGVLTLAAGTIGATAQAHLAPGGQSLTLDPRGGRALAGYGALSVTDATGRTLRAWIAVSGRRLLLRIDDRGARYPLRVDPLAFSEIAKLTPPSNLSSPVKLGDSVAVSANGKTIVIGDVGYANTGVAFVFTEPAGGWQDTATSVLLSGASSTPADFGHSVAVSANGKTIAVGAPAENGTGAAYVYTEPSGGWRHVHNGTYTAELTPDDASEAANFGAAVAVSASGNQVLVGAPFQTNGDIGDTSNADTGRVYVFSEPTTGWTTATGHAGIYAEQGVSGSTFGDALAVAANGTLIVGAPDIQQAPDTDKNGAVYIYPYQNAGLYTGTYWALTVPLGAPDAGCVALDFSHGDLGESVAVSSDGTTIVAGDPCAGASGTVYEFTEPSGGHWTALTSATAALDDGATSATNNTSGGGNAFGSSVAVAGDGKTIIASDPGFDGGLGVAYAITRPSSGGWGAWNGTTQGTLSALDPPTADLTDNGNYGNALSISADGATAVATAPGDDSGIGAAWVLHGESTSTATQVACLPSTLRPTWPARCAVSVTATGSGGTPTGHVSFSANGPARFSPAQCTLSAVSGQPDEASCYVTFTPTAFNPPHSNRDTVKASYAGDPSHAASAATTAVTLTKNARHPTRMALRCSPSPVDLTAPGSHTTCTAKVIGLFDTTPPAIAFNSKHGTSSPDGKWIDEHCTRSFGSSVFGSETCTKRFEAAQPGLYEITAHFPGDSDDLPSSAPPFALTAQPN
jgi:hypothetical protein